MIYGKCPSCSFRLEFSDDFAGQRVICPKCDAKVRLPAREDSPEVVDDPAPAITVGCPRCRVTLDCPPSLAGRVITCGKCQQQIQLPPAGALPAVTVRQERPRRRRRDDNPPAKPSALAPASLALGIVSLVLLFMPCLWNVLLITGGLGFVLGIVALTEDNASAAAWVGTALSALPIGVMWVLADALTKVFAK